MTTPKAIIIAAAILAASYMLCNRFDVVKTSDNGAHMIDQWTGTTTWLRMDEHYKMQLGK